MNKKQVFEVLYQLKEECPDQIILIETPLGTLDARIGDALIYEGMNGEIVIDSE